VVRDGGQVKQMEIKPCTGVCVYISSVPVESVPIEVTSWNGTDMRLTIANVTIYCTLGNLWILGRQIDQMLNGKRVSASDINRWNKVAGV
jgi:hypothetical protein